MFSESFQKLCKNNQKFEKYWQRRKHKKSAQNIIKEKNYLINVKNTKHKSQ